MSPRVPGQQRTASSVLRKEKLHGTVDDPPQRAVKAVTTNVEAAHCRDGRDAKVPATLLVRKQRASPAPARASPSLLSRANGSRWDASDIDGQTERSIRAGAHESIGKGASFKSVVQSQKEHEVGGHRWVDGNPRG